ncbi:DNA gyrase inhibitor YacG [Rhodovulum sp. BSW8]|uniref:DNA gyrase inhibitor YacG n=1 Tax=Rhodovulum visakhapatnamense TaxID=364297 RepID=A0A4R8G1W1_9RHOB|nr:MULTISPECIES: DNA gyrase inhibitor YacG [Rhodovulum]OLS43291.1 DNA gyrase inhibitor YacG [Rhodovulum sulfidophilum]MBL3571340.1 DNA gyrase inhibitor YacG [Rhodovulum visakhapatnamense]MBL3579446.1 DNA gyrase inhibitor YacG [Rhodovulum visakhapatnamense]RBO51657.1 DNA gyrase inhibitor YacG [Rhodovulum sp. BSW8]TDX32027.1 hypothetical protein EV657_104226 [Rhodovulum visakhapatnamense]
MTCPVCKKPTDPAYRPFCSRRCADVDLGRWLTGAYSVPGDATDPAEAEDDLPSSPPRRH